MFPNAPKIRTDTAPEKLNIIYLWVVSIYTILNGENVMKIPEKTIIIVEATIHAPVDIVWKLWTEPSHIIHWNNASDDWNTTRACLLYTSDAADDLPCVDLGGRRIIKKKT